MTYRHIISSRLYVRLKEIVHLLVKHFQISVNKLNNVNVKYLKILTKHRGPQETPSLTTCDLRVACLRSLF